jgi:hypothetical protein
MFGNTGHNWSHLNEMFGNTGHNWSHRNEMFGNTGHNWSHRNSNKGLKNNLEAILRKHSAHSLQKTDILGI